MIWHLCFYLVFPYTEAVELELILVTAASPTLLDGFGYLCEVYRADVEAEYS